MMFAGKKNKNKSTAVVTAYKDNVSSTSSAASMSPSSQRRRNPSDQSTSTIDEYLDKPPVDVYKYGSECTEDKTKCLVMGEKVSKTSGQPLTYLSQEYEPNRVVTYADMRQANDSNIMLLPSLDKNS